MLWVILELKALIIYKRSVVLDTLNEESFYTTKASAHPLQLLTLESARMIKMVHSTVCFLCSCVNSRTIHQK